MQNKSNSEGALCPLQECAHGAFGSMADTLVPAFLEEEVSDMAKSPPGADYQFAPGELPVRAGRTPSSHGANFLGLPSPFKDTPKPFQRHFQALSNLLSPLS